MNDHETIPLRQPSAALRHYRRRAALNASLGLTTKGAARKRRPNAGIRRHEILLRRERGLIAWNLRVNRLRRSGLTTRGTPRIYAMRRADAILLRSELDALASAIAVSFNDLSPAAKARALRLENHLGEIRRQLL